MNIMTQKAMTTSLVTKQRKSLLTSLDADGAALFHSQGLEGAAWLRPPRGAHHAMSDDVFCVCLRRRLLYDDPGGQGSQPCCHKAAKTERSCGSTQRQKYGSHAVCCAKGPGFCRRHHRCRDTLASWCCQNIDAGTLKEQHIPRFDRQGPLGLERGVLDVVLPQNPVTHGPLYIDVTIVEATTADETAARARARRPGLAAADRERTKHTRYPGALLLPAVLEAGGRWGREFRMWARAALPGDEARAAKLAELRQAMAVSLQHGVAAALLGATAAGCRRPWE